MTREEALDDFLKGLKIAYSHACAYEKDHPYFIKSIDVFKEKVNVLLSVFSPVKINFSADAIYIEEKPLANSSVHKELAEIFHRRKIKSLQIREGITLDELVSFFSKITLGPREIFRSGGMQAIFRKENITHLVAEDLDYSLLLRDGGEESRDIWVYLFKEATSAEDAPQMSKLADDFEKIIGKTKATESFEDPEMNKSIKRLLAYLKDKDRDRFIRCSKAVLKSIVKDKYTAQRNQLDEIKNYVKELDGDAFAEVLWEAISTDVNFDSTSFNLFTLLIDEAKHTDIASILADKVKNAPAVADSSKMKKLLKELFFVSKDSYISGIYRNALSSISGTLSSVNKFVFDRQSLRLNYRFILLNILADEKDQERLKIAIEKLLAECISLTKEHDLEYLTCVYAVLKKREKETPGLDAIFLELNKLISGFIEHLVFEEDIPPEYEYFIETLEKSYVAPEVYIDKIFSEKKVNPYIISLFLKFFPKQLPVFYAKLEKELNNLDFFEKILASIEDVQSPLLPDLLRNIFLISNNMIKIEILRMMNRLSIWDKEFLLAILQQDDVVLKKEALSSLRSNSEATKQALDALLLIPSPFGRKDKIIVNNLIVIEELGLEEARGYLEGFSKKFFFCHMELVKKAKEVLKHWDVRKD